MSQEKPISYNNERVVFPYSTGAILERCSLTYDQNIAVIFNDHEITYREQIIRIRQSGQALLQLGMVKGDRIALLLPNSPELLNIYFGALWAGLVVVPLFPKGSFIDHSFIIQDSAARAVIYDGYLHNFDAEFALNVNDFIQLANKQPSEARIPDVSPMDLYGIFYVGGDDGRLKGVLHTHGSYLSSIAGQMIDIGLGEQERFAHVAPITHAGGMFILPVWMKGGTNVLLSGFDPDKLLYTINKNKITSTMMVPTMLYTLLDKLENSSNESLSLTNIIYGVSPFQQDRLLQALDIFGPIFTQVYGITEAPNQLTILDKHEHFHALKTNNFKRLTSLGRAASLTDIKLINNESVSDFHGEMVIRGPHITLGYWKRPKETQEVLRDGWLYTGDIVTKDEQGFLYLVERKKDIIISGGFNIYAKHIEATLLQHPKIQMAAVIGVPDNKWGELVKAIISPVPNVNITEAEIIAWAKERLGSIYTPKAISFVDQIPVTEEGKIEKSELKKHLI
ncbi:acyl-CoA synthetase [Xenorhabdus mauleonii]|uniref:Acyl-CoA synthetase n=1 Tax=Xenorhabdus mauleonii TaxID=351675 RepID=A0A1I3SV17_9GAMM|nr:AMP-binding protein [Xenorhabdus mauleonii]PHM44636.1 acyl-CoA synthetase [Xenorhabdus mauleonii]SFJ62674.1 fatty-acyl-CoA synthase [Xenorhabdus mauleonii]